MNVALLSIKPPKTEWSPLATVGCAACLGSYFGTTDAADNNSTLVVLSLTIMISCVSILLRGNKKNKGKQKLFYVSTLLLFYAVATHSNETKAAPWVTGLDGEPITLFCLATSDSKQIARTNGPMQEFDYRENSSVFSAEAIPKTNNNKNHRPQTIKIICGGTIHVQKGDHLQCTGWLKKYTQSTKPTTLFASGQSAIQTRAKSSRSISNRIKMATRRRTLSLLNGEEKTLTNALFFGVRDDGWNAVYPRFKEAGMAHILAISGMHIAIILLFATCLFSVMTKNKYLKTLLVLFALFFLFQVTEQRPPVTRTLIMIVALLVSKMITMRCYTISFLGISAVVILTIDPSEAGSVGFQLSFIVVAALCVLLPRIKWRILGPVDVNAISSKMAKRWIQTMWLTGLCAWLASFPISIYVFGTIAPVGIISNIPSIFLLVATLCVGIIKTIMCHWHLGIHIFTSDTLSCLLSFFLYSAQRFSNLPYGFFEGLNAGWANTILLLSAVIVWAMKIKKRIYVWVFIVFVLGHVAVFDTVSNNTTTITTVNVGHGTCQIIQNNKNTTLIDGGSRNNFDVGVNTINPILRKLGVTKIDTLVLTHSDIDHISGIIDIVDTHKTTKVIIAPQTIYNKTKPMQKVLKHIVGRGIKIVIAGSGWEEITKHTSIKIISPHKSDPHRSPNAASIVLLLETHGRNVLFTGDIDEQKIIEVSKSIQNKLDVIELPHHGQWSKEAQLFITEQDPCAVIQSTNLSRHAKDRWHMQTNTTRFTTAVDGTITTTIKQDGTLSIVGANNPATMPICLFPP